MAVQSKKVTINTTPVQLVAPDNVRQDVQLHSKHAFFLGGSSGVTSANGYEVDNGDLLRITLFEGDQLWAVASAEGYATLLISAQT